jgi:ComF family protein
MIHLFKYDDCTCFAQCFGEVLAKQARGFGAGFDAIVPIPLSKGRRAWRGYNQSLLLAKEIGKRTGIEIWEILKRKRGSESQVQSGTKEKRQANIKGVFETDKSVPENILLIDDVITSGATVLEATRVLKRAGAKKVCVLALAMG